MDKKIVLASNSKRRKKILEDNGYKPIVISSFGEINIIGKKYSKNIVCDCAKSKAIETYKAKFVTNNNDGSINENIKMRLKNTILVTADTVVVNDGIIYGKPKDRVDAICMIKNLSNKTHIVCTAICLVTMSNYDNNPLYLIGCEETKITFRNLNDEEIENYVDKHKPFDKAGAYGIQDEGFSFVKNIEGNIDNVIGFPIDKFEELIKQI